MLQKLYEFALQIEHDVRLGHLYISGLRNSCDKVQNYINVK